MNFLELKNISEKYMHLVNPISPEKIIKVGKLLNLSPGKQVIDFGCGYGEALALWALEYGIEGVGIDIRPHACKRAEERISSLGLQGKIEIICANASEYSFTPGSYDVAACIGATFIWDGFGPTLRAMKEAIRIDGKLAVGEAYWQSNLVPSEYARNEAIHSEYELLQISRSEGCNLEYIIRASLDDWDNYESGNWYGLLSWIEANPDHPERQQVIEHLHTSQEEYLQYARQYFGWAIWVLNPIDD